MTQYNRLLGAGFIDYLGVGLFLAFSAVYFTEVVGLPAGKVGLGLGLAGCAAMAAAVPLGRAADRLGVKRALVVLHLARALGTAGYAVVGEWWLFLAAVTIVTVADQTVAALTQAYVAELADGQRRVRLMATYRTVANLGISVGGPLGGLIAGTGLFRVLLLANAAAFVVVAAVLATLPEPARTESPAPVKLGPLRDGRLLGLASIDGILQLWLPVLNIGFPLWLTMESDLPHAWLGPLYAINTVLGVLLQVPAARLAVGVTAARRCQMAAAALLATACLLFWSAPATSLPLAVFIAANVLLTAGELVSVTAAWTLSYALAPAARRAEYLSAFGMGRSVGRYVLGPVLITGLLELTGGWTWLALAVLFAAAGAATPHIIGS